MKIINKIYLLKDFFFYKRQPLLFVYCISFFLKSCERKTYRINARLIEVLIAFFTIFFYSDTVIRLHVLTIRFWRCGEFAVCVDDRQTRRGDDCASSVLPVRRRHGGHVVGLHVFLRRFKVSHVPRVGSKTGRWNVQTNRCRIIRCR